MGDTGVIGRNAKKTVEAVKQYGWEPYKYYIIGIFLILIGVGLYYLISALSKKPAETQADILTKQQLTLKKLNATYRDTQGSRGTETGLYASFLGSGKLSSGVDQLLTGGGEGTEDFLVNLCPLTLRLPGFLGPFDETGSFNTQEGIAIAYAAGVRSFFIPISVYYDNTKQPPQFPLSGTPAIVARNNTGKFVCRNAGFLDETIQTIVRMKNSSMNTPGEPILLFLHADWKYLPDPKRQEEEYVKLCSLIATALAPIEPYSTKQIGQLGDTQKGYGNEILHLKTPLSALKDKIIVYSNFDLAPELNDKYNNYKKLGDCVNMKYSTEADNSGPGVKVVNFDNLKGATDQYRDQSRTNFHIALPTREQDISPADLEKAFALGIQCVPLDLFSRMKKHVDTWSTWKGAAWRLKAKSLRYMRPKDIVPQKPSTVLNAKVDGADYAGQVVIKE